MHRLPTRVAIYRFRLASLLLWMKYLVLLTAVGLLIHAALHKDGVMVNKAIVGFIATAGITLSQWLIGMQAKCPLCITPILTPKTCSKNRKAKTFLGSYGLRAANTILFRNYFRCPYCSEPTELQVRTRRPRT